MQTPVKCQYVQRLDFLAKKYMCYIMVIRMDFSLNFSTANRVYTPLFWEKILLLLCLQVMGKSVVSAVLPLLFDKLLGRSYSILMLKLYSYIN